MPKALPDAAKKPDEGGDDSVTRFRLDGVEYQFDMEGISAEMSRYYRRLTRTSIVGDLDGVQDGDIAGVVALVWGARWQAGERIPVSVVDEQLGTLGKLGEVELEFIGDEDIDDDPVDEDGDLDPES